MAESVRLGALYVDTELKLTGFKNGLKEVMDLLIRSNEIALKLAESIRTAVLKASDLNMKVKQGQTGQKADSQNAKAINAKARLMQATANLTKVEERANQEKAKTAILLAKQAEAEQRVATAIEKTAGAIADKERKQSNAAAAAARAARAQGGVPQTEQLARIMSDTRRVVLMIGLLTAGIHRMNRAVYKEFTAYQDAMAEAAAVTEATKNEIVLLNAEAMKIGRTTIFSATEAAKALYILGQAGYRTMDTIRTLNGTLTLAAATGVTATQSVEAVVAILNQFKMPTTMAEGVADIAVATEAFSLSTVPKLRVSMRYVGSVAGQLNIPFAQAATAIGMLSNAGFEASIAGTQLRGVLMRLAGGQSIGAVQKGLASMNIELAEVQARMDDIPSLLRLFEERAKAVGNEVQVVGALYKIFGLRAGPGMATLMRYGADAFDDMLMRISQHGVGMRMAAIRTDTLSFSVKQLWNVIKNLQITFTRFSGNTLKQFIDGLTEILRKVDKLNSTAKATIGAVTQFNGVVMAATISTLGFAIVIGDIVTALRVLMKALADAGKMGWLVSMGGMKAFMLAIAAMTVVLSTLVIVVKSFRDEAAEAFKTFSRQWWDVQQMEFRLTGLMKKLREMQEAMEGLTPGTKEANEAEEQFMATISELVAIFPELAVLVRGAATDLDLLGEAAETAAKKQADAAEVLRLETIKRLKADRLALQEEIAYWKSQQPDTSFLPQPPALTAGAGAAGTGEAPPGIEDVEAWKKGVIENAPEPRYPWLARLLGEVGVDAARNAAEAEAAVAKLDKTIANLEGTEVAEALTAEEILARKLAALEKQEEIYARLEKLTHFGPADVYDMMTVPETDMKIIKDFIAARKDIAELTGDKYAYDYASTQLEAISKFTQGQLDVEEWMRLKLTAQAKERAEENERAAKTEIDLEKRKLAEIARLRRTWGGKDVESAQEALKAKYASDEAKLRSVFGLEDIAPEGWAEKLGDDYERFITEYEAMRTGFEQKLVDLDIKEAKDRAKSISQIVQKWGKQNLAMQMIALDERRTAAEETLKELELTEKQHSDLMIMIQNGYDTERERISRDTNKRIIDDWERKWGRIRDIMKNSVEGPMRGIFGQLTNSVDMAKYSIDDFFEDLQRNIADFLASEAAKDLMNYFMNLMKPGSGGGSGFWGTLISFIKNGGQLIAAGSGGDLPGEAANPGWWDASMPAPETRRISQTFNYGPSPSPPIVLPPNQQIVKFEMHLSYSGGASKSDVNTLFDRAGRDFVKRQVVPELRKLSRGGVTIIHSEGVAPGRKR